MTTLTLNRAEGTVSTASRQGSFFGRLMAGVKSWNDLRVTRNALNALSDRELDDIGLHRGEIAQIGR